MDWADLRTDAPIRVELKGSDGNVAYDADGNPSVIWVWPDGSKEYRAAQSKAAEVMAGIEDEENKVDAIFNADLDFLSSIIDKVENLEFDGEPVESDESLRKLLAAVAPIRKQVGEAARKPSDFLPVAPTS